MQLLRFWIVMTSGTKEEVGEVEESVHVPKTNKVITVGIRQLAEDIDELDNEVVTDATSIEDHIIEGSE